MELKDYISIGVSLFALIISIYTLWLTRWRKGYVKMTRPTVIFFGPDGIGKEHKKIFIRTLLYSSSEKGQYIQNMFVRLERGGTIQDFNVWVYDHNGLVRGSGLYVDQSGIVCNHHFLMPRDGTNYDFIAGEYRMQVFVETVDGNLRLLFAQQLFLSEIQQEEMLRRQGGVYFDWAPNSQTYFSNVDLGPQTSSNLADLLK